MPDTAVDPRKRYAKLLKLKRQIETRLSTDKDHTSMKIKKQLRNELKIVDDEMRKEKLEVLKRNVGKQSVHDRIRERAYESFDQLLQASSTMTAFEQRKFWRIIADKSEFHRISLLRASSSQRARDHA